MLIISYLDAPWQHILLQQKSHWLSVSAGFLRSTWWLTYFVGPSSFCTEAHLAKLIIVTNTNFGNFNEQQLFLNRSYFLGYILDCLELGHVKDDDWIMVSQITKRSRCQNCKSPSMGDFSPSHHGQTQHTSKDSRSTFLSLLFSLSFLFSPQYIYQLVLEGV